MSMRDEARDFAASVIQRAIDGVIGLIERRIDWRRAHAHLLALEAQYMVDHLPRWRWLAILRWRAQHRKWAGRAWAADHQLACACSLRKPEAV